MLVVSKERWSEVTNICDGAKTTHQRIWELVEHFVNCPRVVAVLQLNGCFSMNKPSMNASSWFRLSQWWKTEKHDQRARHGLQCNYYNKKYFCHIVTVHCQANGLFTYLTCMVLVYSITASFFTSFLVLALAMVLAISTIFRTSAESAEQISWREAGVGVWGKLSGMKH